MTHALVLLASGTEEIEAVTTIDLLRRAQIDVVVAGLHGEDLVECSRGVRLKPDGGLDAVQRDFDAVVLPGGMGGAEAFAASEAVGRWLRRQVERDRTVGAICAAPMALVKHQVYAGFRMTSHPVVKSIVESHGTWEKMPVVKDRNLITSQGPGTAIAFGLMLIEHLEGIDKAAEVRAPLMIPNA